MSYGFENQSAFSRRFKKIFGYTPSKAREKINIVNELESVELEEPDIINLEDISIQAVTETGLYFESAPKAWSKLKSKLNDVELSDDFSGVFIGIGHDNPHMGIIPENKVRFSAGVSHTERDIDAEKILIAGGRYARFHYQGKINNLGLAYHYIFGQWASGSPIEIDESKFAFIIFANVPEGFESCKAVINVPLIYL